MPEIYKYTIDKLGALVDKALKNKIPMVALFPSTPKKKKDYYYFHLKLHYHSNLSFSFHT